MKKSILYVATSDIHIATFHLPYIKWLSEQGYAVDLAVEIRNPEIQFENVRKVYNIQFPRAIFNANLYSSYKELKSIIDLGNYKLVHCHTPVPSLLTRLASRAARKLGTTVLYTAHGFHFYKGAPFMRWAIYYTAEKWLSKFTDGIITINAEDFNYVKSWGACDSYYIKGIGVDSQRFIQVDQIEKNNLRDELGYNQHDFILLYIAEFIDRKNHKFIIEALPNLVRKIPNLKLLLAGKGVLVDQIKNQVTELKLDEFVDFLGFRKDVHRFSLISDIGVSASKHEGLGLGLAEQMMCGVPIVATMDRGHKEMVISGENGYLFEQGNHDEFVKHVLELYQNAEKRNTFSINAIKSSQQFDIKNSLASMVNIYNKYLD